MERRLVEISKTVSHALRHAPWLYELELDSKGFVEISALLDALRRHRKDWLGLGVGDLQIMIQKNSKKRHEIIGNKIRALYGHSIENALKKEPSEPPEILFHGTSPNLIELIKQNGLLPMSRQFVHFSSDRQVAIEVGKRKSHAPKILIVKAKEAYREDVKFYFGNEYVWLADNIPEKYIIFNEEER